MDTGLISQSQIDSNLRRTAIEKYISLLKQEQLEYLAYKYFGIYEDGILVGYECPYSGKRLTNRSDIVLEHIIPVASKGGTVLFNCIPASYETNSTSEKGAKHLIEWWFDKKCKYNDEKAPHRLEKLVNYILEAYDIVFNETTMEELEESYLLFLDDSYGEYDEDNESNDYSNDKKEEQILEDQAKHNHITSYLGFLNDLVRQLKKSNIDTTEIQNKIKELENKGIFEDITKIELVQKCLQQTLINILGDDNRSYLTYSLNINVKRLMDSIPYTKEEEITNEIQNRLNNINKLCIKNNISIIDYFKNLRDIEEVDILYNNIPKLSQRDIDIFIENIEIGHETKIQIFIEMLNQAETLEEIASILKSYSTEHFRTYKKDKSGNIIKDEQGHPIIDKEYDSIVNNFWISNPQILSIIRKEYKELSNKLDEYYVDTRSGQTCNEGRILRQNILIEMLNQAETPEEIASILKNGSTEHFRTYKKDKSGNIIKDEQGHPIIDKEYDSIVNNFWISNPQILSIIRKEYKELSNKLDEYYVDTRSGQTCNEGRILRQNILIEMLNQAETPEEIASILKNGSTEHFRTYKKDKSGNIIKDEQGHPIIDKEYDSIVNNFWISNPQILSIIRKEYKELSNKLDEYYVDTRSGQTCNEGRILRQNILIEMLNQAETPEEIASILKNGSTEHFRTYKKDKSGNIIKDEQGHPIIDKEYDSIVNNFWISNPQILSIIRKEYKELSNKLDEYYVDTRSGQTCNEGRILRQNILIEMLNQAETPEEIASILKNGSTEHFRTYKKDKSGNIIKDEQGHPIIDKEYDSIVNNFWISNPQILSIIRKEYKELSNKLDEYYVDTRSGQTCNEGRILRQNILIEMLNQAETPEEIASILKNGSTEHFRTYKKDKSGNIIKDEHDKSIIGKEYNSTVDQFWSHNSSNIIQMLFYGSEYNSDKYDPARNNVLQYLKVSSIDEYIDKLDKSKKKNKVLIELRDKLKEEKESLIKENDELRNMTDEINRKKAI